MLDRVLMIVAVASACVTLAGGAFFIFHLDERVAQMQALDEAWVDLDAEQTADIVSRIEEVLTALGIIGGRLDGTGGGILYTIGYRDGAAACAP